MIWVAKYLLLEFRTNLSEVQSYARKRKHGLSQLSVQSGDNKAIGCSIGVHVGHAKYEEWAYQLEAAYFLDANHFWGELMLKIWFMCRWGGVNMSPYTSATEDWSVYIDSITAGITHWTLINMLLGITMCIAFLPNTIVSTGSTICWDIGRQDIANRPHH